MNKIIISSVIFTVIDLLWLKFYMTDKYNIMINLFYEGGVLFMSIISFFLIMTGVSFYTHSDKLKTYGNLGLVSGILGSFIGLYSAFEFIQQVGDVSPSILAGGIRVALICTLYGLLVYIISRILYLFR